jgi:hypothetical protein
MKAYFFKSKWRYSAFFLALVLGIYSESISLCLPEFQV